MSTQVALFDRSTGSSGMPVYYATYDDARAAASSGDLIEIVPSMDQQLLLKNGVDILIKEGTWAVNADEFPLITDGGDPCVCNIYGGAIFQNAFPDQPCVKLTDPGTVLNMQCDSLLCVGGNTSSVSAPTIEITGGAKFNLVCNQIQNDYNSAIYITGGSEIFIQCNRIISGTTSNTGAPVVVLNATGVLNADEIICKGTGTCLQITGGLVNSKIGKLITLSTSESSDPTLLLSGGSGTQELILYFNEIQNLNVGEAVKANQGKLTLIGNKIFSNDDLTLNFIHPIISAYVQCDKIISTNKGIHIENQSNQIIIDANYIEGGNGNNGVIRSALFSKYIIRNAKIVNTYTGDVDPYSIGIFINYGETNSQTIELENLIIVTGNDSNDLCIKFEDGLLPTTMDIKNLNLFSNKGKSSSVIFLVGDTGNNKFITSGDVKA